jgi:hypothetical protein
MAYFHPFRPFVKRTLGFSVPDSPGKSFHLPCNPLMHFRATQAACPHACRAFTRWPRSTSDHPQNAPRIRSSAFKHFRIEKPFFSPPVSEKRVKNFALFLTSPVLGFGSPLHGGFSWPSDPWGPLSVPNALRLHSSELFSSLVVGKPFPTSSAVLALFCETTWASHPRFNGLFPPEKLCPSSHPRF